MDGDGSLITVNRVLIDQLTNYENKNIKEHNELKIMLSDIKTDLSDLFVLHTGQCISNIRRIGQGADL